MTEPHELDWARKQLVAIDDELARTPADDLARRHTLHTAGDTFRKVLRDGNRDAIRAAQAEWSSRAGRKGGHEIDHDTIAAMVRSMMPSQGR